MPVEASGGTPAWAQYRRARDGGAAAWALLMLEVGVGPGGDARITAMTSYLDLLPRPPTSTSYLDVATRFPRFGRPLRLS